MHLACHEIISCAENVTNIDNAAEFDIVRVSFFKEFLHKIIERKAVLLFIIIIICCNLAQAMLLHCQTALDYESQSSQPICEN